MRKQVRYSPEVRERAVRMVFEHKGEYESQWAALGSIANKVGCTAETLRKWVRRAEVDQGRCNGLTSDDRAHMKELEKRFGSFERPMRFFEKHRHISLKKELDRQKK